MQLALHSETTAGVLDSCAPSSSTRRRTYLAAGVALAGAGLIAINPVASTLLPDIPARAVQLAGSAIDLGSAVGGVFDTLGADALNTGALGGIDGTADCSTG